MCLSCFLVCFFTYQNVFLCNFEKSYSSHFFFQDTTCNTDSYHVFRTFDWHPNPGQVSSQIISVSSCGVGPIDDLCFMCLLEIFQINADWDCLLEHVAQHTHTHQRRLIYSSSVVVVTSFPTPLDMVTEGQIHLNI